MIAGNWKMNKLYRPARELFDAINAASITEDFTADLLIAPPTPYLAWLAAERTGKLHIAAQDVAARPDSEGAFTGEHSAAMLASMGVGHAIVGHSERRTYHGESDLVIARKIEACIAADVAAIYCCGEVLQEREAGRHTHVVEQQVRTALHGFTAKALSKLVIAYEPVWAIGTGHTATAAQAQEMHLHIRSVVSGLFGAPFAERLRILYGGSLKPQNAEELLAQPDIDGGLIGGASLQAADFLAIARAAQ